MFLEENHSKDRLQVLNQAKHGLSKDSVLSQQGFIKANSRPTNPNEDVHMPYDTPVIDYIALRKQKDEKARLDSLHVPLHIQK